MRLLLKKQSDQSLPCLLFRQACLFHFGLVIYIPVDSYGHVEMVSSANHTFCQGKLNYGKRFTGTSCTYYRLSLTTTFMNQWKGGNYFTINLHKSMRMGQDRTRNPWICSQTRICSQTHPSTNIM